MHTQRQLTVAEPAAQKKPQRRGFVYKFVHHFTDADPNALDPYEDYPNGFIFLVILALVITFVNLFAL